MIRKGARYMEKRMITGILDTIKGLTVRELRSGRRCDHVEREC